MARRLCPTRIAAGHRMFEIYDLAAAHGSTTVGSEDQDVDLGGYLTGGHSPISGHYVSLPIKSLNS